MWLRNFMITDGSHPSYMDPDPTQNPSSTAPHPTTQQPCVAIAGPPFFRYKVIDMSAELVVEAGIPVTGPVDVEAPSFVDVLPAGRYATVTHIGHPDELMAVTAKLLDWAREQGLAWDVTQTPEGEVWGSRLEISVTNPMEEPDMHKWETILMFRLAD
jgi:hypothetical protein